MWRIKEELSAAHVSWEEYLADIFAFQEEERKRGVKFVSFEPKRPVPLGADQELSVAEASPPYDGSGV